MGTEETDEIKETIKLANDDLMNWGRYVNNGFLEHHLMFTPLPTSEGYVAPINIYDEPEPPRMPVDEADAQLSEHVVISIGVEPGQFLNFRALVAWYTKLVFIECTTDERYKRLSKQLKCSFPRAKTIMEESKKLFWKNKIIIKGLVTETKKNKRKNAIMAERDARTSRP